MSDPSLDIENQARRARLRARRRRRYRLRQRAVEVGAVLLLALLIATPIWLFSRCGNESAPLSSVSTQVPPTDVPVEPPKPPYPTVDEDTAAFGDNVNAKHALLWDVTEGRVVAARNPDGVAYPASVTKVMTLLVAVENITDFTDTFTMTYDILHPLYLANATIAGFKEGEAVLLEDLLYGTILPSGADACQALAEYVAGSEKAFVALMNQKAVELGLKNTHFVNTSGLHDPNHYTTVADMVVMLQAAMENPHCRQILSTQRYTSSVTPEHPEGIAMQSTMFSRMYGTEPGVATIVAGKTGFTNQAMHTMVSYAVAENGHEYIFASLYSTSRRNVTFDAINSYKTFCTTTKATTTKTTAAP